MTSLVLESAQQAMQMKAEFNDGSKGNLGGKKVVHWSTMLHLGFAVVGAVAGVAALILLQYPTAIACGVIAVSNALASLFLRKFSTYKTLGEYVAHLSAKVKALVHANEDLKKIQQKFSGIPEDYERVVQEGSARMAKQAEEIAELTKKLEVTEEKLQKLGAVANQMRKVAGQISEQAVAIGKENGELDERLNRLGGYAEKFEKEKEGLGGEVKELDVQTDEFDKLNDELEMQVNLFQDQFVVMKDVFGNAQQRITELEKQVQNLKDVVPDAVASTDRIVHTAEELEELNLKLEEKIKMLKHYKEWLKAWKESSEKRENGEEAKVPEAKPKRRRSHHSKKNK